MGKMETLAPVKPKPLNRLTDTRFVTID